MVVLLADWFSMGLVFFFLRKLNIISFCLSLVVRLIILSMCPPPPPPKNFLWDADAQLKKLVWALLIVPVLIGLAQSVNNQLDNGLKLLVKPDNEPCSGFSQVTGKSRLKLRAQWITGISTYPWTHDVQGHRKTLGPNGVLAIIAEMWVRKMRYRTGYPPYFSELGKRAF